jgi:hypothetical protein
MRTTLSAAEQGPDICQAMSVIGRVDHLALTKRLDGSPPLV